MNSVFVYESFTPVDSVYSRNKHHVTDPVENIPPFTQRSTTTRDHTFHGRNILYCSNFALNEDETPPGPYDDDNDDDDDDSD